ncbi:MAG: hypothetical protein PHU62_02875 [Bacteroidales bacterium]|jgi:cell division protein FtsQ|nr:hypothetical protein [Bacteroidales bacterium]MDD2204076.1 hypothetical protein [Bacteroidales bacterium]MDD3913740.1 hypothetical protein [Bacteroidales bacterium]MDD4633505.1 hypothetical protein [Bacteroidales bacterium]
MNKFSIVILKIISAIFIVAVIALVVISSKEYRDKTILNVNVAVKCDENRRMLNDSTVKLYLQDVIVPIIGTKVKDFSDSTLLGKIRKIESVENTVINCDLNGNMIITITQKLPIAKIYTGKNKSYKYLTANADVITSAEYYGTRLFDFYDSDNILLQSNKDEITKEVSEIVQQMWEDAFLSVITDKIIITKDKQISLKSFFGNQEIIIGNITDLDDKSNNLKLFYEAVEDDELAMYKIIDLRFNNQIVATK